MTLLLIYQFFVIAIACNDEQTAIPEPDELVEEPVIEANPDPCSELFPPSDTVIATHTDFTKTNYPARIKVFQADTIDEGDIVMLGNSLTQEGGNWNIKLSVTNAKNRGISGDNTDGVMARLNELTCRAPSIVFMMIGTNDLWVNYSAEKVAANIHTIGTLLSDSLPDSKIILQTIMPLAVGNSSKSKLVSINDFLKTYESAQYQLVDTYNHMANEEGDLPAEYTYDGVHLTTEGYAHWLVLLKEYLNE